MRFTAALTLLAASTLSASAQAPSPVPPDQLSYIVQLDEQEIAGLKRQVAQLASELDATTAAKARLQKQVDDLKKPKSDAAPDAAVKP